MGERALTGTKKLAREGNHAEWSLERPPPGTMVDVRVVLELPAPGVQDTGEPRQVGSNETFVGG
jgi:hypothetical protein